MINYKRLLSLAVILPMTLSLVSCGKSNSVKYDPLPKEDDTVYNISLLQDEDNDYYNGIAQGFTDALNDLFGENHIKTSDKITADTQLIFANGSDSLDSAASSTQETPIVGAGVMDFQRVLHLTAGIGDKWNKKTGTNVTGVSSEPDIAAQLSLIIETAPNLKTVGLLYTPDDSDSLFQLEIMEKYLDQAGIPWKEYMIPLNRLEDASVSDDTATEDSAESTPAPVIQKSKVVASSATEVSNNQVDIFGETNLIDGIINPSSAHSPLTSQFWTPELSANNPEPLPEGADLQETVAYASRECSCLYIPTGSNLVEQASDISDIATAAGVYTVGGDANIGQSTFTCTYMDSYGLGYSAGKKAYRILVNGDNPGDLRITTPNVDTVKLYNSKINETFGMDFPKSFHEINEFLKSYEVGSTTNRITELD